MALFSIGLLLLAFTSWSQASGVNSYLPSYGGTHFKLQLVRDPEYGRPKYPPTPRPTYPPHKAQPPVYEEAEVSYKPSGDCQFLGQYLSDTSNQCNYRRCVVQREHWVEGGDISLEPISFKCAPGTAVPENYREGDTNPCTEVREGCNETPAEPANPSYNPVHPDPYPRYRPVEGKSYPPLGKSCYSLGHHLKDAGNKCKFQRCVAAMETVEDHGNPPLTLKTRDCAPGTAVPDDYQGGYDNPCTLQDKSCGAPETPEPRYPPQPVPHPAQPVYLPSPPTYPEPVQTYQPEEHVQKPMTGYGVTGACHARGQYLRDPKNPCQYHRCVVRSDSWRQEGNVPLDMITVQCAKGSSVPEDFEEGYNNPCTETSDYCKAKTAAPSYPGPHDEPKAPVYPLQQPSYQPQPAPARHPGASVQTYPPQPPVYPPHNPSSGYGNECHARGQFLRDPTNQCQFRRCVVKGDNIPLETITKPCASGTAVPKDFQGGYENPCSESSSVCDGKSKSGYSNEVPRYRPLQPSYQPQKPAPHTHQYPGPAYPPVEPSYPPKSHEPSYPPKRPQPSYAPSSQGCHSLGQHMKDGQNKCHYRRCVVQVKHWDGNGRIPLNAISQPCAPGTAVPDDYLGGYDNPCTVADHSCGEAPVKNHYAIPPPTTTFTRPKPGSHYYLRPMAKYLPQSSYPQPARNNPPTNLYYGSYGAKPQSYPPKVPAQSYEPSPVYPRPTPAKSNECHAVGQHLRDPQNPCKYRRCDGSYNIISFDCAPGSSVPYDYQGGYDNPCTLDDKKCLPAPPKKPVGSYPPPPQKPVVSYPAPPPQKPVVSYPQPPQKPVFSYPQPPHTPSYPPTGQCYSQGQMLKDPTSPCKFQRCLVDTQHWEKNGVIRLRTASESCAPGSSVPADFNGGYENPCTATDPSCKAPPAPPKTRKYPSYDR